MKTNAAPTSIAIYHNKIKGSHENSQDALMYEAIKKIQPCTARQVYNHIHCSIEIGSVVRSINNLKRKQLIEVATIKPCPISGNRCQHYQLLTWQTKLL
jgi:hypothetical protein